MDDILREHPKLSAAALFSVGLVSGLMLKRGFFQAKQISLNTNQKGQGDSVSKLTGDYKLIMVVRNDLKMGKGKIAAQCAHSAVGAVEKLAYANMAALRHWQRQGQPKVAVKVDTESDLHDILREAQKMDLNTCLISDAGRTQIAAGSKTVLAVGPGPVSKIDKITGNLKLL